MSIVITKKTGLIRFLIKAGGLKFDGLIFLPNENLPSIFHNSLKPVCIILIFIKIE